MLLCPGRKSWMISLSAARWRRTSPCCQWISGARFWSLAAMFNALLARGSWLGNFNKPSFHSIKFCSLGVIPNHSHFTAAGFTSSRRGKWLEWMAGLGGRSVAWLHLRLAHASNVSNFAGLFPCQVKWLVRHASFIPNSMDWFHVRIPWPFFFLIWHLLRPWSIPTHVIQNMIPRAFWGGEVNHTWHCGGVSMLCDCKKGKSDDCKTSLCSISPFTSQAAQSFSPHWRVGFLFLVLYPRLFLLLPVLLLTHSLTHAHSCSLMLPHAHSCSLTHSCSLMLTHSLTHSFTPSLTHSLTLSSLARSLAHSLTFSFAHLCMHIHTHTHTNSPTITPPSLLYFLFPSCFSMLSLSLEKLVTCGVIRSYNFLCGFANSRAARMTFFRTDIPSLDGLPPVKNAAMSSGGQTLPFC